MEGSSQDQTPAGVVSEEIISRVATETGLPEKVVRNIIALKSERSAEEMRDMPAERVRDMILDMFRERGATNTEPPATRGRPFLTTIICPDTHY
jgi:hypothetical protein